MSVHATPAPVAAPWLETAVQRLAAKAGEGIPYLTGGAGAAEPTALAAMALNAQGRSKEARSAAEWLKREQAADGSIAVRPGESRPAWPTSLALIVWNEMNHDHAYDAAIAKGTGWLLGNKGAPTEQTPELGHNTRLIGWSWAENTHSWLEPTAFAVLSLRALGKQDHARVREAVRLMENRLLDSGGCNYGNTTVFGQELRPHIQPTGTVLLALAGEAVSAKISKATDWLESQLNEQTPASSLGWGLMGLRAQGVVPGAAQQWLAAAAERVQARDQSPAKLALLALASSGWPGANKR
jgi:hypothetical protein